MKRHVHGHLYCRPGRFHFRMEVATLKLRLHKAGPRSYAGFNFRKEVATLKRQFVPVGFQVANHGFHFRKEVATLKRTTARLT